jgi:hypothetical protein
LGVLDVALVLGAGRAAALAGWLKLALAAALGGAGDAFSGERIELGLLGIGHRLAVPLLTLPTLAALELVLPIPIRFQPSFQRA